MAAARYWARGELRRRWRATVLLIALVGLAGGVLLTTIAGARRSSTAYDRFREHTLAADLDIALDGPPSDKDEASIRAIERLPQVEAMAQSVFPFIVPAGSGSYPYLDFLAVAGVDMEFTSTIDRPRMLDGRLPHTDAVDEIAILELYAREADVGVGDRIDFESYAPDQLEPLFSGGGAGPPAGPRLTLVVTGILDAPDFLSESVGSFQPRVFLSPAFQRAHADDMATYPGGFRVRLRNGEADLPAVSAAVREIFADAPGLELQPASDVNDKIDASIEVIVAALLLSALVAGIASTVAIAQALSRHFSHSATTGRWLVALGMTRHERTAALFTMAIPVALGGAALAVLIAGLASPLMPVGLARRAEPDRGFSFDGWVLGVGFVTMAVGVAALALLVAASIARRTRVTEASVPTSRPSRAMLAMRQVNLPPAATTGVGMALDPARGSASSVRAAFVGVAFGATGVVAAVVFASSLTTLVGAPAQYGAPWDALVSGFAGGVDDEGRSALVADPDVERLGVLSSNLARIDADEVSVHSLESLKGDMALTLLDGRLPVRDGEVALGASTMRSIDGELGGSVEIEGAGNLLRATIVGRAAFPVIDERSSVGRGVLLTSGDLAEIGSEELVNHDLVITWAPGLDEQSATEEFAAATGAEVSSPTLPADVNNLRQVEALPRALAALLALLATLATTHALVSTVRIRRQDLAVLRTLGFQRRQLAATLAWQATTIVVAGLLVGVPLGLVGGRLVWHAVADGIGVVDRPTMGVLTVAIIAVTALVVANLAAALPARVAGRVRPATILRTG